VTTLVTGFDPFGGRSSNPSQAAGAWLADHRDDTVFVPLPTSYAGSITALQQAVETQTPTAVLLLGFAAGAVGLRPERCAHNLTTAAAPDNDGQWQSGPIHADAPDRVDTSVDYDGLLKLLDSKDIPHSSSDDAGGYVCNWLYWHALVAHPQLPILFVHLAEPPARAQWRNMRAGLLVIADAMAVWQQVSTRRAASPP